MLNGLPNRRSGIYKILFEKEHEDSTNIRGTEIPQLSIVVLGAAHLVIRDMDADHRPELLGV